MTFDIHKYTDKMIELFTAYSPKLLLAFVTLIVGSWVIKLFAKLIETWFQRAKVDETLKPYFVGISTTVLKVILYISVIGMVGVQTTSFIAVLGAAGLAIGMALQGSLSNFAGGVLLLIFKPIRKGDFVETQGVKGTVESIQPFVTVILSPDNVINYVPNGAIASGAIKNYTVNDSRRVDLVFGIGYEDNIDQAKEIFKKVATSCPNVLIDKGIDIQVSELADSSVNFVVRPFCRPQDYWGVYTYMQENVKKELDKAGISIPYPQRDVHMHEVKS